MVPNVLLNVEVKVNQLAIENGQKKILESNGTKPDVSEMTAWGRSQVHKKESSFYGVVNVMTV